MCARARLWLDGRETFFRANRAHCFAPSIVPIQEGIQVRPSSCDPWLEPSLNGWPSPRPRHRLGLEPYRRQVLVVFAQLGHDISNLTRLRGPLPARTALTRVDASSRRPRPLPVNRPPLRADWPSPLAEWPVLTSFHGVFAAPGGVVLSLSRPLFRQSCSPSGRPLPASPAGFGHLSRGALRINSGCPSQPSTPERLAQTILGPYSTSQIFLCRSHAFQTP